MWINKVKWFGHLLKQKNMCLADNMILNSIYLNIWFRHNETTSQQTKSQAKQEKQLRGFSIAKFPPIASFFISSEMKYLCICVCVCLPACGSGVRQEYFTFFSDFNRLKFLSFNWTMAFYRITCRCALGSYKNSNKEDNSIIFWQDTFSS